MRARAYTLADTGFRRSLSGRNRASQIGTMIVPKKTPSKKDLSKPRYPLVTDRNLTRTDLSKDKSVLSEKEGLTYKVPPLFDYPLRSTGRAAVSPFFSSVIGQAQALDHGHVFDDGRARRRQHIPRNRRRGTAKKGRSPVFRQELAAGSQADVGFGIDEAEEGNGPQDIVAGQFFPTFKRRAGNGHQGVDGNGFDAQFRELRAISSRSSQVSPMPMMPPEQTQSPSA